MVQLHLNNIKTGLQPDRLRYSTQNYDVELLHQIHQKIICMGGDY